MLAQGRRLVGSICPEGNLTVIVLLLAGDMAFKGACGAAKGVEGVLMGVIFWAESFERPCRDWVGWMVIFLGALGL